MPAAAGADTADMRAFFAWVVMAGVSVVLGMALYTTSLAGSTTGYQEAPFTPGPTSTVVKTKTKIVRKPAKTKVIYVPQATAAPAPAAQEVYVPPATSSSTRVSGGSSSGSLTRAAGTSSDTSSDSRHEHEDEDD